MTLYTCIAFYTSITYTRIRVPVTIAMPTASDSMRACYNWNIVDKFTCVKKIVWRIVGDWLLCDEHSHSASVCRSLYRISPMRGHTTTHSRPNEKSSHPNGRCQTHHQLLGLCSPQFSRPHIYENPLIPGAHVAAQRARWRDGALYAARSHAVKYVPR